MQSGEYEGEYRTEKRHGSGSGFRLMSYSDGSTYEGEWKNSLRHGYGVYIYPNGDKYEGQWYNGLRHGIGTHMHVKDDCSFHGTWHEGQRIGPAEIRNKNYRFHWKIDKPIAFSAFTFGCDTMMTGCMDIEKTDDSSSDLQWYTEEISRYDRNKLPPEPSIFQFTENLVNEPFHDINSIVPIDESAADESGELQNIVDYLYENMNIMNASVQVVINEPSQQQE